MNLHLDTRSLKSETNIFEADIYGHGLGCDVSSSCSLNFQIKNINKCMYYIEYVYNMHMIIKFNFVVPIIL